MTKYSKTWFKAAVGIALLVVGSMLPMAPLSAQPLALIEDEPGGPIYLGGQVLVQFKTEATDAELLDVVKRGALTLIKHIHTDAMKARSHPGVTRMWTGLPVRQTIQALKNHPAVEFAEPNWVYTHQTVSNDPYYTGGFTWGLYGNLTSPANQFGSQAGEAWAAGYVGAQSVYVGVVDEGIQYTHPDLSANVWTNPYEIPGDGIDNDGNGYVDDIHGWDFYSNDNSIYDGTADDHGTHVTGTIAATGGNGLGVPGINWHVTYISGKFLGPNGGYTSDAIEAVDYFTDLKTRHGLNIVALNNSWGGGGFSQALLDAVVRAAQQNILFVAAAGNGDRVGRAINTDSSPSYPSCYNTTVGAGYDSVISVTAIDNAGSKASWANYGATTVDLGAPGVGIYSTLPTDSYGSYSGTSMATPHVTGAAALYASTHPGASAAEIKSALLNSTLATASLAGKTVTGRRLNLSTVITPPGPPTTPLAPMGLSATPGDSRVSLTWNASSGATSYNVKRGTTSQIYDTTAIGVTTISYINTTAVNGITYYYVVSAVNSAGESGDSAEISATPQSPPTAPSGLSATAVSKSQIKLSWTDNSGNNEDGFKIERSTDGSTFAEIATVGKNVTTFQNTTGLSRNKTYYYRVRAYNSGGNSGYSNTGSAKTLKN